MADKPLHFYDPLKFWEAWEATELTLVAQQALQLVAGDFAHQLRGRGQYDLVDELRALCLQHGFPVHI